MPVKRALTIAAAGVAAAGALALPAAGGAVTPVPEKTSTVKVADDFYSPTELSIGLNDQVKWSWDPSNTNTHNVVLKKGPKGVKLGCKTKGKDAYSPLISKCNKSGSGAIGIKFKKKFDIAGKYDFICTIHPDLMKLTVNVKGKKK